MASGDGPAVLPPCERTIDMSQEFPLFRESAHGSD